MSLPWPLATRKTSSSALAMDPYLWREPVLSTRSLSYLSTVDAVLATPGSRAGSASYFPPQATRRRRETMDSSSDYGEDLEMPDSQPHPAIQDQLSDIVELPTSVVESPLFRLPRELRDSIYAYCLSSALDVPWPRGLDHQLKYNLQPQVLRLCHAIYAEALPVLYSSNKLSFSHPTDANIFVRAMTEHKLSRRHISSLRFDIDIKDTRLWMPYLTSSDTHRSLRADFPSVRDLVIRFASTRWNHAATVDSNVKAWWDTKLSELVDGLRSVYFPRPEASAASSHEPIKPLNEMSNIEFWHFVNARRPGEDLEFKKQLLDMHKVHVHVVPVEPPEVEVWCVCRVHIPHFRALIEPHNAVAKEMSMEGDFRIARTRLVEKGGVKVGLQVACEDPLIEWRTPGITG